MSQTLMPSMQVGNEFLTAKPKASDMKVEVLAPEAASPPQKLAVAVASAQHVTAPLPELDFSGLADGTAKSSANGATALSGHEHSQSQRPFHLFGRSTRRLSSGRFGDLAGQHRIATSALITLIFGSAIIILAGRYWSVSITTAHASAGAAVATRPVAGLNLTVPAADLQTKLQTITGQKATLTVGPYSEQLSSDNIKSWLQITANKQHTEYYIHLNEAAMSNALLKEANEYARTPVNQVTVNEDGASVVAVAGRDGRSLTDPDSLKNQSNDLAKNVLGAKGLQFNTPLKTAPFQALTAANFDKLIVANITSKKMWAYQNGQVVNTFLTSDGGPATPTPTGQYHIYAKYSVQDMHGYNPNGTKYFQPRVPWVNYFTGGNAIHGVYWHGSSWFGNINSSHGCVGLPVDQAKWVFDWAPIGTTVITHA